MIFIKLKNKCKNIFIKCIAFIWILFFVRNRSLTLSANKILLILPSGIGNTILANGAIKSIKKYYPYAKIVAIYMQEPTNDIIRLLGIDESIFYDLKNEIRSSKDLINNIKNMNIDISIGFFPQGSRVLNRCLMRAGIPVRIGFWLPEFHGGIRSTLFLTNYLKYDSKQSEFQNDLNLLDCLNIPQQKSITFCLSEYYIKKKNNKIRIGIHVGRSNVQKSGWPKEKFCDLINLIKKFYECDIFIFGGEIESEISSYFNLRLGNSIINLIGKTKLGETVDYIHSMDLFVSNDTGLMHIAASQSTPVVAIFGPTDCIKSCPIVENEDKLRVITKNLDCQPCYPCSTYVACRNTMDCISKISVDDVLKKVHELIILNTRGNT